MKKENPNNTKAVLLEKASELFYEKGFLATGVQEILNSTGVTPPSLYHHFGSKNNLGLEYLTKKKDEFMKGLLIIQKRNRTLSSFLQSWCAFIEKQIDNNKYFGCPFVKFSYEISGMTPSDKKIFQEKLKEFDLEWSDFLVKYLNDLRLRGIIRKNIDTSKISEQLIVLFQGAISMWTLTKDKKNIKILKNNYRELSDSIESIREKKTHKIL